MTKNSEELPERPEFGKESFVELMAELFAIKGYKASAIMTNEGELLFSNFAAEATGNVSAWTAVCNSLFAYSCSLSATSGFDACNQVAMRTLDETVVIRSSGQDSRVGIRILVLLDRPGAETTPDLKLEHLLPALMRCLTSDPENLVKLCLKDLQATGFHPAASAFADQTVH